MKAHISRSSAQPLGLVWGIDPAGADWQSLQRAAAPIGMTLRPVSPAQAGCSLIQLCSGMLPPPPALAAQWAAAELPALVMANLKDGQLDLLLAGLRAQGLRIPLKAVVTPTNLSWVFRDLLTELARERQALGDT